MITEQEEQVLMTKMTKISESERVTLTRWFGKQSVSLQARIEKEKKHIFYKVKNTYPEVSQEFQSLAAHFLSMKEHADALKNKDTKNSGNSAGKKLHIRIDAMKKSKRKTKSELVLERQGDLRRLYCEDHCSYREIAAYFKTYLHINVSHTTIGKVWQSLQAS